MRAFVLYEAGGMPELGDFDEPTIQGDGQEVATILAAGMNPVDAYLLQNPEPLPRVVGMEGIGLLADGSKVYIGQSVSPYGTFAEKALALSAQNISLPEGLENGPALTLGIAGMAAWLPLEWKAKLQPGESVLILGATGVQGQLAVQAAKIQGAGHVVAAGRDRTVLESLKQRGADEIVLLEGDIAAALKAAAPKEGYHVVIDSIYGDPFAALLESGTLGADSRVVVLGGGAGQENMLAFRQLQAIKGATIAGYSSFYVPAEIKRAAFLTMAEHVRSGSLHVAVKEYSLEQAAAAWKAQGEGLHQKIVIVP